MVVEDDGVANDTGDTLDFTNFRSSLILNISNGTPLTGPASATAYLSIQLVNLVGTPNGNAIEHVFGAASGIGGSLTNQITGNDRDNRLVGGPGFDTLSGGVGNDTLEGGAFQDRLEGGAGDDLLIGDYGFAENTGNDILIGGDGNDTLISGVGNDTLEGGSGDDVYRFIRINEENLGSARIVEETDQGNDWLDFSGMNIGVTIDLSDANSQTAVAEVLTITMVNGNVENVQGSDYGDHIIGDDANNYLLGGAGDDTLEGGRGNDTLEGGEGNDTLLGGAGANTYRFPAKTTPSISVKTT